MMPASSDAILRRRRYAVRLATAHNHQPFVFPAQAAHQIVFALEGDWQARLNEQETFALHASDALLLSPHTPAQLALTDRKLTSTVLPKHADAARLLALTLSPTTLLDVAVRARLMPDESAISFRVSVVEHDARLALLAEDVRHELTMREDGSLLALDALVEQLAIHLLRRYVIFKRAPDFELSRVGVVDRRIRRAIELMHAHLEQELALEELAAAAYLSPFHFARLFKKITNATPHAYLANLRINRAQDLLINTDLSVTEIAHRVGFQNSSHFAKAFRQATHLAPTAFRKHRLRSD